MIDSLKQAVLKFVTGISRRPSQAALRLQCQRLLGPCPACGGDLSGHRHWRLASVFLDALGDESGAARRLVELIAAKHWTQAASFQEWAADRNELEYHVIGCPVSGALSLVPVVSKADMWADDEVQGARVLSADDSAVLSRVIQDLAVPGQTIPARPG